MMKLINKKGDMSPNPYVEILIEDIDPENELPEIETVASKIKSKENKEKEVKKAMENAKDGKPEEDSHVLTSDLSTVVLKHQKTRRGRSALRKRSAMLLGSSSTLLQQTRRMKRRMKLSLRVPLFLTARELKNPTGMFRMIWNLRSKMTMKLILPPIMLSTIIAMNKLHFILAANIVIYILKIFHIHLDKHTYIFPKHIKHRYDVNIALMTCALRNIEYSYSKVKQRKNNKLSHSK